MYTEKQLKYLKILKEQRLKGIIKKKEYKKELKFVRELVNN
jgi:hypothetical protein